MIFIGYFEGIGSQRGIAWRCADSLSLREFLGVDATQRTPDHSSLTVIRKRLPIEVFYDVFTFVLKLAEKKGFFRGKIAGIDATLLEANAAMKSIVRRDTGDDWKEYVKKLAAEEGVEIENDEDLRRFDKKRKNKKVSNKEWTSPTDPDSRIMRMKDGRTHLSYKAEHAIDLETDLATAAEIYSGDESDGDTLARTAERAKSNTRKVTGQDRLRDIVADKGYHKAQALVDLEALDLRSYIPEREGLYEHRWTDKPEGHEEAYRANRRRVQGNRSKKLQRLRSEYTERSFAHTCETGDARRSWLRGLDDVRKRHLALVAGRNLGVIMREVFGFGSPRSMQDLAFLLSALRKAFSALSSVLRTPSAPSAGPNLVWAA
jgi:transposase